MTECITQDSRNNYKLIEIQILLIQKSDSGIMKFDDILVEIGEFGRYQKCVFLPVVLIGFPAAFGTLTAVFLNAKPNHWCAVDKWSNDVDSCYNQFRDSDTDAYLDCIYQYRDASIPGSTNGDGVYEYELCHKYDVVYPDNYVDGYDAGDLTNDTTRCNEGWVYDRSQYKTSIVTDFDLVCDKKTLPDWTQTIYFFGLLVGSFLFGSLADIIGRKKTWFISITTCITLAFAPSYWMFTTIRFLNGIGDIGLFLIGFVIVTELVGPSYRVLAGLTMQITYAIGYAMMTVLAYFIRKWRTLWIVLISPTVLFFLLLPLVPESARWLISRKRYDDAEKIIRKTADVNRKPLPDTFMETIIKTEEEAESANRPGTVIDLFKTKNLRFRTISLMFNWFVINIVYFGLSLGTSDLGSNDYITSLLSAVVEIPAYCMCIPLMNSIVGRGGTTSLVEILGGLACLSTIFLDSGIWQITVAMIGKFMISAAFGTIYTFSAEIFPTPLRTVGMGMCSTCSRVGAMLAPVINLLNEYWGPLPLVIFGGTSLIAGMLALPLPETRGTKLPETIEEGETFGMQNYNVKIVEEEDNGKKEDKTDIA